MEWSDEATIGYNAGGEYNASHPLSGTLLANAVDCLHSNINVTVNNIILNLVPGVSTIGTAEPPVLTFGMLLWYNNYVKIFTEISLVQIYPID